MAIENTQRIHFSDGITLPLTTEFKQIAQKFAQQCPLSEKAVQIRQNTLAVCAVNAYLQLLDIDTNLSASDSWNPMMQMLANVADLKIPEVGTLSCRPLAPQASTCYVPPEDWQDRAGYVAVVVNEPENQATLIGFTPTVEETEQVALDKFAPIEMLIEQVHSLRAAALSSSQEDPQDMTQLGQWLKGTVASSWQRVNELISPSELNFAFRSSSAATATNISRAQLIDLGIQLGESLQVALIVHLGQVSEDRNEVTLQVHPLGDSNYLPEGISLAVLDENHNLFRNAVSRTIDNYIQIQMAGEPGEHFSVQISKGETTFTERFAL